LLLIREAIGLVDVKTGEVDVKTGVVDVKTGVDVKMAAGTRVGDEAEL
jgi:hypothetical protein